MCPLHIPAEPTGEEVMGMVGFATSTPGVGGRLRAEAEDFVVVEEQLPPPRSEDGPVTAITVRLRNWETNRFVRQMSRRLGISYRRVRFAGVKDKRAVTTQLMTVEAPLGSVRALRMPDVEVLDAYSTDRHLTMGKLVGNRFQIAVEGLDTEEGEARGRVAAILEEVVALGGFPNFYGHQRFGVARPVSHLVGLHLVRGDVEDACWTYLTHEGPGEGEEALEARRALAEDRDVRNALRRFPGTLGNERNMLEHLLHHPDDPEGALRRLPFNLQLMFVHAFQGLVFNHVLCERLSQDLPLDRPVEGDVLVPLDVHGNPVHDRPVPVSARNLAKAERQVERGRALVTGLVPGTEAPMARGEMGGIEEAVMARHGLDPGSFRIVAMTELSSPGIRRELALRGVDPRWDVSGDRLHLGFRLGKGCYATVVARELMKSQLLSY